MPTMSCGRRCFPMKWTRSRFTQTNADDQSDYLIVQETNFPGWQVTIDGVPASVKTIRTAYDGIHDGRFIAIMMSPGQHIYVLHFDPPGLTLGVLFFVITLIAIAIYLFSP